MKHYFTFWKAMLKKPLMTGAVVPSSKKLCDKMLEHAHLEQAHLVVELGPGTGALTKRIAPRLKKEAHFLCIDANPVMVKFLKKEISRAHVIHDNAEHLKKYIDEAGMSADVIFSSIPFVNLPRHKTDQILESIKHALKPEGKFVMYQYMHTALHDRGKRVAHILKAHFKNVRVKKVFGNIPPAFVITCEH